MNPIFIPESVNSRASFREWWGANVSAETPPRAAITASVERVAPTRTPAIVARLRGAIVAGFAEGFGQSIARKVNAAPDWLSDPGSAGCVEAAEKRAAEKKVPLLQAARELHAEAVHAAALEAVESARAAGRALTYRQAVTNLTRRAVR